MSKLSPWNAARRVACPGSRALEELFPQDMSTYAREGKAAHYVASEMLRSGNGNFGQTKHYKPPAVWEGIEITDEMIEGASLYVGFVSNFFNEYSELRIEEPLNISVI